MRFAVAAVFLSAWPAIVRADVATIDNLAALMQSESLAAVVTVTQPIICVEDATDAARQFCQAEFDAEGMKITMAVQSVRNSRDVATVAIFNANSAMDDDLISQRRSIAHFVIAGALIQALNPELKVQDRAKLLDKVMRKLNQDSDVKSGRWFYFATSTILNAFGARRSDQPRP